MNLYNRVLESSLNKTPISSQMVSNWLTYGLRHLIDIIPVSQLHRYVVKYNGIINPNFFRIYNVFVNGLQARLLDSYDKYVKVLNPYSIDNIGPYEWVAYLNKTEGTITFIPSPSPEVQIIVTAVQYYSVDSESLSFIEQGIYLPNIFEQGSLLIAKRNLLEYELVKVIYHTLLEAYEAMVPDITVPELPSFNYSAVTPQIIGEIEIPELPPVPVFSLELITQDIDTNFNLSILVPTLSLPSIVFELIPDRSLTLNTAIQELDGYFQRLDNNANGYLEKYEDLEITAVKIQEIQTKLQEIQTELQLALERESKNLLTAVDIDKANASLSLQKSIEQARTELDKYSKQLQVVELELQRQLQQARLKLDSQLQRMSKQLEIAATKINSELTSYKTTIDKILAQLQLEYKRLADNAAIIQDIDYKNAIETVKTAIEEYSAKLNHFKLEIDLYSTKTNALVQKFFGLGQAINAISMSYMKHIERINAELNFVYQIIIGANNGIPN